MPKRISKVILGVGGGIAAYKSCDLLRRMQERNYDVTVVPTPSALNFVGTATWEALSGKKVTTQVWESVDEVRHVKLAAENDLILISPATADLIARIAMGRADDLLTNLVLASSAVKVLIPAMHPNMWNNAATVANIALLQERGFNVMRPAIGRLTGADSGIGRLPETPEILSYLATVIADTQDFLGKRVLVTAGGTREAIDPVRFIGNHSTGKMGFALAEVLADSGAEVMLVTGPVVLKTKNPRIQRTDVVSAQEMADACLAIFPSCDAAILSAAVADFRPVSTSKSKIKKGTDGMAELLLEHTTDILATLGKIKNKNQTLVGFALETENEIENAKIKLEKKNLDFIVLNSLQDLGAGFGVDTNKISIFTKAGKTINFELKSKADVAADIVNQLVLIYKNEA